MTLAQLAAASNVSIGLLSRLENGVGNATVQSLRAISEALDIDLEALLGATNPPAVAVVRAEERYELRRLGREGLTQLVDFGLDSGFATSVLDLPAGASTSGAHDAHEEDEFLFVMCGEVIVCAGGESLQLGEDDSVIFGADQPHWMVNHGSAPAEILVVTAPPRL